MAILPFTAFFQALESDITRAQTTDATTLLECLEEEALEIASILSSTLYPSHSIRELLHRQRHRKFRVSIRTRLPDGPLVSLQISSPASNESDVSCQSNDPTNSSSLCPILPTLTVEKKSKTVRFVEGVEHNPYTKDKAGVVRIARDLETREAHQELFEHIITDPLVTQAILGLQYANLQKIIDSLDSDVAKTFANIANSLLIRYANTSNALCAASIREPKQALLLLLDVRSAKQHLRRSCDLFHQRPPARLKKHGIAGAQLAKSCCPSQYVIGHRRNISHLFDGPFSFAQIQFAMKLFRQDLNFSGRLKKPLCHGTVDIHPSYSHIRTSDVYPAFERLLSRTQHWYHISSDIESPFSKEDLIEKCKTNPQMPENKLVILCQHLYSSANADDLWDFQDQENNPSVRRCQHCALEYRFDWYDAGEHGSGIVLSIWRDLGRCFTPFDPRWMAHFEEYKASEFTGYCKRELEAVPEWYDHTEPAASEAPVGYIQKMFEDSAGFDLQEGLVMLTSEQRKVSFEKERQKRKKTMDTLREHSSTYMLQKLIYGLIWPAIHESVTESCATKPTQAKPF